MQSLNSLDQAELKSYSALRRARTHSTVFPALAGGAAGVGVGGRGFAALPHTRASRARAKHATKVTLKVPPRLTLKYHAVPRDPEIPLFIGEKNAAARILTSPPPNKMPLSQLMALLQLLDDGTQPVVGRELLVG